MNDNEDSPPDDPIDREVRHLAAALAREPHDLQRRYDLAAYLWEQGRFPATLDVLTTLLAVAPDQPEANFMLGQLLLLLGRFPEGWVRYAWRYRMDHARGLLPRIAQPCWQGAPLKGKTLLVFGEQGFGDTLQFVRFVPLLLNRGEGKIIVGCSSPLQRLLKTLPGGAPVISNLSAGEPFDLQLPVSALPGLVGADLLSLTALPVPYLWADPVEVKRWQAWRDRAVTTRLAVGVVWAGRSTHAHDHRRSLPLALICRLGQVADVTLVSLQLPTPPQETLPAGVLDISDALPDFAATAAAMLALDLIVTVDTAVAHLAGALGRPVWTLLSSIPDWRWLLERDDSPWYPSMRLFRQRTPGDWSEVMDRVAAELQHWTPATTPPGLAHTLVVPHAIEAWSPSLSGASWHWPVESFFPPHPPWQERVPCRCCRGHARWISAVDFSRCRADAAGFHLPPTGVPVDYYHCARCGCRFTGFFDHWEASRCRQLAVDPLRVLAESAGHARERLFAVMERWGSLGGSSNHILVMDSDLEAWKKPPGGTGWRWSLREPFQDLSLAAGERLAMIILVDTLPRHPWPDVFLRELLPFLAPDGMLLLVLDAAPEDADKLVFPAYTPRNGMAVAHTCRSLEVVLRRHGLRWQQPEPGLHLGKRK
ncbi:MAG: hypothetical protein HQL64_07135 [Magnetococcales bacterium]|nr:hypothetical protein [Magnetococcales bacterium]